MKQQLVKKYDTATDLQKITEATSKNYFQNGTLNGFKLFGDEDKQLNYEEVTTSVEPIPGQQSLISNLQSTQNAFNRVQNEDAGVVQSNNSNPSNLDDLRVKLYEPQSGTLIVAKARPTLSTEYGAQYQSIDMLHVPFTIQKYVRSSSRSWSITLTLFSRTPAEARNNQDTLNFLKSLTKPFYGQGTANDPQFRNMLGAPPPILYFSAYGKRNLDATPVVVSSVGENFPNDVNFISTALDGDVSHDPFPAVMDVSIHLLEALSPNEIAQFSIADYRKGVMVNRGNSQNKYTGMQGNLSNSNSYANRSETIDTNDGE